MCSWTNNLRNDVRKISCKIWLGPIFFLSVLFSFVFGHDELKLWEAPPSSLTVWRPKSVETDELLSGSNERQWTGSGDTFNSIFFTEPLLWGRISKAQSMWEALSLRVVHLSRLICIPLTINNYLSRTKWFQDYRSNIWQLEIITSNHLVEGYRQHKKK